MAHIAASTPTPRDKTSSGIMHRQTRLVLAVGLSLAAVAATFGRPARLRSAALMPSEGGGAPHAAIALAYTRGLRPASVIIDIHSLLGSGSATADGDDHVFVPLSAPLASEYAITVQMTTRLLGWLWTQERRFTVEPAQGQE